MACSLTEADVRDALRRVRDPELDHDIVELGMVREIEIEGDEVSVNITPTSTHCPFARRIEEDVRITIAGLPGVASVVVEFGAVLP